MKQEKDYVGSILMLSAHGYVAAEPELGKPDTGGQVTFVLELAKCFAALGYRVDLVTRGFEGQAEFDRISEGLRVWRIPFGGPDFIRKEDMHDHLGSFVKRFLSEVQLRRLSYDFVSSHYWDAGWAGQAIAEKLGLPHIHTPHSLGEWKRKEMQGMSAENQEGFRFDERIRKEFLIYRRCDHVIATTHQQVDLLHEDYGLPEGHITMIPPGIDESKFTPVSPLELAGIRSRLGFLEHDVYSVGRAATNKGYDLLVRSLPELKKIIPKVRLQLAVGANSEQDRKVVDSWRQLAQSLGVAEQIRWLDYIPDEAMADYYRAGGVFAMPSRYEPFGMTAIEAMACGTPSVVTVHGGLHEMLDFGQQAFFADPKCPTEFASLLSLPLRYERIRETLSVEGAQFSRRNFGWMGIARKSLECFQSFQGRYANRWERKVGRAGRHGDLLATTSWEDRAVHRAS